MGQSTFEQRFNNHIGIKMSETKLIMHKLGIMEHYVPRFKTIKYNDKISNSEQANDFINEFLNGHHGNIVIAADTGAGKTWWCANAFHTNSNQITDTYEYNGVVYNIKNKIKNINILCVPNRNQAIQAGLQYNLPYIVGGVVVTKDDLLNNDGFVTVYDKITEVLDFIKVHKELVDTNKCRINLIVDEAHLLIEADYRPICIKNVLKTIEEVKKLGGNVAYMSASFEILDFFDVDEILGLFDNNSKKENTKTTIIQKNSGVNVDTFLSKEIYRVLNENGIAYVRYQKKDKEDAGSPLTCIVNEISNKLNRPVSFYTLNSSQKEIDENGNYENKAIDLLIKEGKLPKADIYFCTSMVDAGTNITAIVDENGNETQPTNIVPIYVLDANSCSIDCIEQSYNRIRWEVEKREILLCGENESEPEPFGRALHNAIDDVQTTKKGYEMFIDFFIKNQGREKALSEIKKSLAGNDLPSQVIKLNEQDLTISISYIDLYRYVRNKYMCQYLNIELLQEELQRVLGGTVEVGYTSADAGNMSVDIDVNAARVLMFNEIVDDNERLNDFDKKQGKDWELIKGTEFAKYYDLIRKENNPIDTITMFSKLSKKELVKCAKEVEKNTIKKLDKNDIIALECIINNKTPQIKYRDGLVYQVFDGLYKEELNILTTLKDTKFALETIINNDDKQIKEVIEQEFAKDINNRYMVRVNPVSKREKEQYAFIQAVEKTKGCMSTVTISKDNNKIQEIRELMIAASGGKDYTTNKIMTMAKRVYKTKSNKDRLTLYTLNK